MLGEFKQKLMARRAQGAFFVADATLEGGDVKGALGLYRGQARELGAQGIEVALQVRGWLGVLRCVELLVLRGRPLDPSLDEAIAALSARRRDQLPDGWGQYDAWRDLMRALIRVAPASAERLGIALAGWFGQDPRVHYARGRALEARMGARAAGEAQVRRSRAREAIAAYRAAMSASAEARCVDRWAPTLHLRIAGLLWRVMRAADPQAQAEAWSHVQALDRRALAEVAPSYRLVAAQVTLGMGSSMARVRALDTLRELAAEPTMRAPVMVVVEEYLEGLGWGYYATEQDRVRAIVARCAPTLGAGGVRRASTYLDLLEGLRGVVGAGSRATTEHLQMLYDLELEARGDTVAAAYYRCALAFLRGAEGPQGAGADVLAGGAGGDGAEGAGGLEARLGDALGQAPVHLRALESQLAREPLALALRALELLHAPERGKTRALLQAFAHAPFQVPHVQAALTLALPVLMGQWEVWIELQPLMREALERYIRLAPQPSFGFGVLARALLARGESELARAAMGRALTETDGEQPETMQVLRGHLAAQELSQGRPEDAVHWLLQAL